MPTCSRQFQETQAQTRIYCLPTYSKMQILCKWLVCCQQICRSQSRRLQPDEGSTCCTLAAVRSHTSPWITSLPHCYWCSRRDQGRWRVDSLLRNRIRGRVALATAPRILVLNFHSRFLDSKLAKKIFVGACGYSISKVIFLYLFHITLNLVSLRFATQAHV